jgi:hypothetical protein
MGIFDNVLPFGTFFSDFGIIHQEKSGNPVLNHPIG